MFTRKKSKGPSGPPPRDFGSPPPFGRMPPPRFGPPSAGRPILRPSPAVQSRPAPVQPTRAPARPMTRAPSAKDKEMDETLKKLKKMSE